MVIPTDSFFLPDHDFFYRYTWLTVALWTGLRGAGVGFVPLLGVAFPLQLAMALLNELKFDSINWLLFVYRNLWLLTSFVIAAIAVWLLREAAWTTALEGLRAGREAERADALRDLHDTVLQRLGMIAVRAVEGERAADELLQEVRGIALQQAAELRAALRSIDAIA